MIEKQIAELLQRTGVGAAMLREAEEQRAAAFEAARQRKQKAVARYRRDHPKALANVCAADDRATAAREAKDAAIAELAKAAQARDEVVGQFGTERELVDAELRRHADPRVDVLKAELTAIRRGPNFRRDTHEAMSAAVSQVADLLDELERVRTAGEGGEITDIGAALDALRDRIPR